MKTSIIVVALLASGLSSIQAQYQVVERGADYKVLQKTGVVNGTNWASRYTAVATGLNFRDPATGQWTESKEQISVLPTGGAVANQARHSVAFPPDIGSGVLKITTPGGQVLQSRPLCVTLDDGRNTVVIGVLTNAAGWLTASNQVTYKNCFCGIHADLVCDFKRGGFACSLVFREQPPAPDVYGLSDDDSTIQLVTEFFNTQDPQRIPAASDDWFGLQDDTLKFSKMTMGQGNAFTVRSQNSQPSTLNPSTPVYKNWLHIGRRTFLIEQVPLVYLADELDALPLSADARSAGLRPGALLAANSKHSTTNPQHSTLASVLPPARPVLADNTNQIQIASTMKSSGGASVLASRDTEPGVVLDYNLVDSDSGDVTFASGQTYFISGVNIGGTVIFEGGAVLKFSETSGGMSCSGDVVFDTSPEHMAVFTSENDDSAGEPLPWSNGSPTSDPCYLCFGHSVTVSHCLFRYAGTAVVPCVDGSIFNDCQFYQCGWCIVPPNNVIVNNALVQNCYIFCDGGMDCQNATFENGFAAADCTSTFCYCSFSGMANVVYDFNGGGATASDCGTGGGYQYSPNGDTDYDGLPDAWEMQYFGNLNHYGSELDGLGNTLLYDYQNGLNPLLGIATQPANQTVNQGSNATFSVTAAGTAPLSYQWWFSGSSLLGATNASLTLTNVQPANAGSYHVIVTNVAGQVTSSDATLTVLLLPTISITNPANNAVVIANQTNLTLMTIVADGAGTITQVQFFQGTASLGTVTTAPFNLTWNNATTGNYALMAVASDDHGYSATSSIVNVTITPLFATNAMRLWLKADSIAGLNNNAPVGSWPDKSGWGNDATQNTLGNEPLLLTNVINALPVVRFDGTSSYFNLPNFMSSATGGEAFAVIRVATNKPPGIRALWQFGTECCGVFSAYPDTVGNIGDDFGNGIAYSLGTPTQPLTQYHVYEVSSQNNSWSAWINGILFYHTNNNTVSFSSSPQLGRWNWGNNNDYRFGGDMAEVLVFNRGLTDGERTTVNSYLNAKYGLVAPVPPAPTYLMATAVSQTQIGLTWGEALTNGGATRISIERKIGSGGTYAEVARIANALSYMDTNLLAGTNYYYRVRAINLTTWSPYSNETNATTLSSGADMPLSNLQLWLKADTGLLQGSTTTPVELWADQSGNGNNAGQANTTQRPLWVAGALNGRPVVRFDGTSSYFSLTNFMNGAAGGEALVVVKVSDPNGGGHPLWEMGGAPGYTSYSQDTYGVCEAFGSTSVYNLGVQAQPMTQYHVYEVSSQNNSWSAWTNGVLMYQTSGNTVSWSRGITLGYGNTGNGGNKYFAGDMAEVLVFNRGLTDSERTTVNSYLNAKYGFIPTVSIINPTNNSLFVAGSNISLSASASEAGGGSIKQVEYFQGTTSLGAGTTPPYSVTWNNVASNSYALTARATGANGLMATSSVVNIAVHSLPTISITNPVNNMHMGSGPANVAISAAASDLFGITQVQFFQGTTSLGIVFSPPYNTVWNNVPAGNYALTAVALASDGFTTTSSVVNVIVDTDADGDGLSDYQENLYGTNPNSSDGFWIWVGTPNGFNNIP